MTRRSRPARRDRQSRDLGPQEGPHHPRRPQHLSGADRGSGDAPRSGRARRGLRRRRPAARREGLPRDRGARRGAPEADGRCSRISRRAGLSIYDMPEYFIALPEFPLDRERQDPEARAGRMGEGGPHRARAGTMARAERRLTCRCASPGATNSRSSRSTGPQASTRCRLRCSTSWTPRSTGAAGDARALLVTGAGEQAFCAGADIKELMGRPLAADLAAAEHGQTHVCPARRSAHPSIALINGSRSAAGSSWRSPALSASPLPTARAGLARDQARPHPRLWRHAAPAAPYRRSARDGDDHARAAWSRPMRPSASASSTGSSMATSSAPASRSRAA